MTTPARTPPPEVLIRAFQALGKLVASEYPDGYALATIADIWGGDPFINLSGEEVAAIRTVEECLDHQGSEPVTIDGGQENGK